MADILYVETIYCSDCGKSYPEDDEKWTCDVCGYDASHGGWEVVPVHGTGLVEMLQDMIHDEATDLNSFRDDLILAVDEIKHLRSVLKRRTHALKQEIAGKEAQIDLFKEEIGKRNL